jgi:hypothetical protein
MKNTLTAKFEALAFPTANVKPVVLASLGILAVLTSMYVYFVGKIVFDVVARREAESTIHMAQSSVSQLQVAYFNKTRSFSMADAGTVGLSESHNTLYASRTNDTAKTVGMLVR